MDGVSVGGIGGVVVVVVFGSVVERHSTQCSFLSSTLLFSFLSAPFTSPSLSVKRVRQEEKKRRGGNRRPSLLRGDNNSLFFISRQRALTTAVARRRRWGVVVGRAGHTKGLATDISWKLLDDVSAHQRTATAIVGLIGRWSSRRHCTVACFGIFTVLHKYLQYSL